LARRSWGPESMRKGSWDEPHERRNSFNYPIRNVSVDDNSTRRREPGRKAGARMKPSGKSKAKKLHGLKGLHRRVACGGRRGEKN